MSSFARFLLLTAILLVPPIAHGADADPYQAGDPINDRFALDLGTFLLHTSTDIQLNGATGKGTEFNAEHELGFTNTDRIRADAYWRFFKRHKLRLMYFEADRHATHTIDRQIQFRDTVYPVNAEIDSRFNTRVIEIAYEYSFLRRENFELAVTGGIHNLRFNLDMAASGPGMQGRTLSQSQSANADGPLPAFGLHGVWRLGEHFFLDGEAEYFAISIHPYDGSVQNYSASVVWQIFDHLGIGAGYNKFITNLGVSSSGFDGNLRWSYGGVRLFLRGSF